MTEIRIEEGEWGGTRICDISAVLYSVASELLGAAHIEDVGAIIVEYKHSDHSPKTLYRKGPGGEYIVWLNTQGNRWDQYSYQFAHELCHIITNYRNDIHKFKWFEETICELASLFTMRRMAETWKSNTPDPNWKDYYLNLWDYVERMMNRSTRTLPNNTEFKKWFSSKLSFLEDKCDSREDNGIIANYLLPIFETDEKAWIATTYLNKWDACSNEHISDYFASWYRIVPIELRKVVESIAIELAVNFNRYA